MAHLLSQFRLSRVSKFSKKDKQELVHFQGVHWLSIFKPFLILLLAVYLCLLFYSLFISVDPNWQSYTEEVARVKAIKSSAAISFLKEQQSLSNWLGSRATSGEQAYFNYGSEHLLGLISSSTGSFLAGAYSALLRILFLIIASAKFCLLALVGAFFYGKTLLEPYESDDLLGQTGNGKLFYTGVKAKLENLTPEGIPDKHVTGLACPRVASASEIEESELGSLLEEYEVDSETNLVLAGIILELEEFPAFVAHQGGEKELNQIFPEGSLPEMAESALQAALAVQEKCVSTTELELHPEDYTTELSGVFNTESYGKLLEERFYRVLSPSLRVAIAKIDPSIVATTVLSVFAGKVLAYEEAGGKWFQCSAFPQLSARSVLHSIPSLSLDYDYGTRSIIRRALIYGKRSSIFGAVRFPADLALETRALRQWVELLLACPHELNRTSIESEYFHLIRELNDAWGKVFTSETTKLDDEYPNAIHATKTNLLMIPAKAVLSMVRKALNDETQQRLQLLTKLVSDFQNEATQANETLETLKTEIPEYERVFSPFPKKTLKELQTLHQLDEKDLKLWSAIRMVFFHNGWLARRIGDYTVPETGIVFTILSGCTSEAEKNHLGLFGQRGMIAFRASRLKLNLGEEWHKDFYTAQTASMAEDEAHFNRQLQGIPDDLPDADDDMVMGA